MKRLQLILNEPGSGEITVPLDSAMAANLVSGTFQPLKYRGTEVGGIWIEDIDRSIVDSGERSGRQITARGRGPLAILDDAIVWDWMTPALETDRYFWLNVDGTVPAMFHKGEILAQLIHEALDAQYNANGDLMDRKCWHDAGDNHILAYDFTSALDSDGIAWDVTEADYIQARVGTSLLDMARQFVALGMPNAAYEFGITATHDAATGITTIHVRQTPQGVALASTVVHFRIGHNCTLVSDTSGAAELRNAILINFSDPLVPYTNVTDATSITANRRRESLLQASDASTLATAQVYGNAELDTLKNAKHSITLKISDAVGPKYLTDYNLGDWIYYDDGTGTETAYRIVGIKLEWDDDWYADVVVTLNSLIMENELRSARDLRRVGAQSSGSSLMNPKGADALYSSLLHIPSGTAADGQVLTADGLGSSVWENVDGGSGTPGGVEHLHSLLHFDGVDGSQVFTDALGLTWTYYNHAQLSDTQIKFGLTSGYFDGTDDYIKTTGLAATGTSDFTMECWIYLLNYGTTGASRQDFLNRRGAWNDKTGISVGVSTSGKLTLYNSYEGFTDPLGSYIYFSSVQSVSLNEWHHVALVRHTNDFQFYLDGIKDANHWSSAVNLSSTVMEIGRGEYATTNRYVTAYIDEFAFYDYAKYTASFHSTLPTLPYELVDRVVRGTTILFRRGDAANLPTLFPGEPFIALDTGGFYIGDFLIAPGSGGYGDILGTGVVGQLAEFVTDTKHIQAAKLIGPVTNILTITNAAAATLALAITAGKTLTLTTTDNFNLTVPATLTVAGLGIANVFTTQQMVDGTSDQIQLRVQGHATQTTNLQTFENSAGDVLGGIQGRGTYFCNLNTTAENLFIGPGAGNAAATGTTDTAVGSLALASLSSGVQNMAFGRAALYSLTTGNGNVAIGFNSLIFNDDGNYNVGLGSESLRDGTSIDNDIAIGASTLYHCTGNNNVAIGIGAGYTLTNSEGCIFIGYNAGFYQTGVNAVLAIDYVRRASAAEEVTNSIIYGQMAATVAGQTLLLNAGNMGFFGHAAAAQPTKAGHNNWANISDVVQALADLGLVDAV